MTFIVTGAAGFIGSNLIKALNARGEKKIIAVDDLQEGDKFRNLVDLEIDDYIDKKDLLKAFGDGWWGNIRAVFHEGACANSMENDGAYMMEANYQFSNDLCSIADAQKVPFIYASSAAVYGRSTAFEEKRINERPLNVFAYSKFLCDQYKRGRIESKTNSAQLVGLRYFNVYGPQESHKKNSASMVFQLLRQYQYQGFVTLFGAHGLVAAGEQRRDFVTVDDVVKANLFFLDHSEQSGIFNVGTGNSHSYNDIARESINALRLSAGLSTLSLVDMIEQNFIRYIPFPQNLVGKYQSFTQANIEQLRAAGYSEKFIDIKLGIPSYSQWLMTHPEFFY